MSSPRLKIALIGGAVAVAAGILADQGSLLGADLPHAALLGVSVGAVVGLVHEGSVAARTAGFVGGFLSAWIGYALRAGFLPDIPMGRAIAAVVVVGLVTALAVASAGKVPLWSGLLGAGALLGAYETTFRTAPTTFLTDSVTAATTVLLAAALGLLVATAAALPPRARAVPPVPLDLPAPRTAADTAVQHEVVR